MALIFFDGLDYATTPAQLMAGRWTAVGAQAYSSAATRFGSGLCWSPGTNTSQIKKAFSTNYASLVCGFAYKWAGFGGYGNFQIRDGGGDGNEQITLLTDAQGHLQVRRGTYGGTVLATSAGVLSLGVWYYVEVKTTINNSGSIIVKINEVEWINYTGDTQNTGNAYMNQLWWLGDGANPYMDDIYVLDLTGIAPLNDFLGNTRVFTKQPSGAGAHADFTGVSGANYANVDEIPPDDDTTYNHSSTINATDTFAFADIASSGTVYAVEPLIYARKDDANARVAHQVTREGATDYEQTTDFNLSDTYAYFSEIMTANPSTGSPWTLAEFNASEFGYKLVS